MSVVKQRNFLLIVQRMCFVVTRYMKKRLSTCVAWLNVIGDSLTYQIASRTAEFITGYCTKNLQQLWEHKGGGGGGSMEGWGEHGGGGGSMEGGGA